jgi:CMP-N-acetylneuraminic acid synthetase
MRTVALIPAKSVSHRLPGKNLKPLAGMPLFLHSVNLALRAGVFDAVYVSSDAADILALADQSGAIGLPRPPALCDDTATNFLVLRHHVAEWRAAGDEVDIITLLQPTTPFRTAEPLGAMLKRLVADAEADSLVTVARASRLRGCVEDGCWRPDGEAQPGGGRIQALRELHEFTGHVVMLRPARTLDRGSLLGERILAEPLPAEWPDIDIDTPEDWRVAEAFAHFHAGEPDHGVEVCT